MNQGVAILRIALVAFPLGKAQVGGMWSFGLQLPAFLINGCDDGLKRVPFQNLEVSLSLSLPLSVLFPPLDVIINWVVDCNTSWI